VGRDRRRNPLLQGVVVLDKPAGMTSQQAVSRARASMRIDKMGHGGTLDPFATGVLPLMVNSATRIAPLLTGNDKYYRGVMRLGVTTDTLDPTGEVLEERPVGGIDRGTIEQAVAGFVGDIEQIPPMYSAKKIQGKRLYELARKNVEVEREPKPVTIHAVEVLDVALPDVTFEVHCSAGTYVRVLVDEVGKVLECGAHLAELVRQRSGEFRLEHGVSLDRIDDLGTRFREEENARREAEAPGGWRWTHEDASAWWAEQLGPALVPVTGAVALAQVALGPDAARRLRHGEPIRAGDLAGREDLSFEAGEQLLGTDEGGRTLAILKTTCRGDLVARMEAGVPVLKVVRVLRP